MTSVYFIELEEQILDFYNQKLEIIYGCIHNKYPHNLKECMLLLRETGVREDIQHSNEDALGMSASLIGLSEFESQFRR